VNISPETLQEEGDWEKRERQSRTGVMGNGLSVWCQPYPWDPGVGQQVHRAICLARPHPGCATCPHQSFTLIFKNQPPDPYQLLACPRWREGEKGRLEGKTPDSYVPVERAICLQRPFQFCSSCPTPEQLVDIGADKVRPGWYGRWHRFTSDEEDQDG
jgi:hypothetical protein